ncbi:MAG TPA: archaemetzincin family Zn-dependent metalloprotease [Caldisericia bacterium]|nr:archaemetzincin family Zn-dependent metalloprotease [Caldisericia bacterium]HOL82997.1 archaemetzincin family Zn-dependent metalloprotease [Caldisericia bacterium]HPC56704.1 archaemetzincin family Zn-dependent metalloprotease [Caldisericia bacterium]HPP43653.1 archaemetzincin family Zn-dependent metalloprotease [Caldisericia bacterium]HRT37277.1 archaemetzincin family Zn-dependent metalloprotease [Caldisericia bacterium]
MNRSIKIVPLIDPPNFILNEIKENFERIFNLPVFIEKNINIPVDFKNSLRNQYPVRNLISYLEENIVDDCLKIIGIINKDIYEEGYNFLFGSAEFNGKYAVISLFRLYDEDKNLFLNRSIKESIHEIGHTFGLNHCNNKSCVMNFSLSIKDVDRKQIFFCKLCETKLRISLNKILT